MARVNAVPQPDLVLIYWCRNPLVPGARLINALNCLLDNDIGFKVVYRYKRLKSVGFCY